jgi:hypothetical protein
MNFQPKILHAIALLLFAMFLMAGCSKKNNNTPNSGHSLTGEWVTDSAFVYSFDSVNGLVRNVIYDNPSFYNLQYFQFNADSMVAVQGIDLFNYDVTGSISLIDHNWPYSLHSDSILILNHTDTLIISFTSNTGFVLHSYNIQPNTNGYSEYYYFK